MVCFTCLSVGRDELQSVSSSKTYGSVSSSVTSQNVLKPVIKQKLEANNAKSDTAVTQSNEDKSSLVNRGAVCDDKGPCACYTGLFSNTQTCGVKKWGFIFPCQTGCCNGGCNADESPEGRGLIFNMNYLIAFVIIAGSLLVMSTLMLLKA